MKYLILTIGILMMSISANELQYEESPYLKQHAKNPVHWLPWGDRAFNRAKREDKLIFLSIGYSTCHWCHVMEHESFENKKIANILNRYFISIKVDREEHPNIDKHYQEVYRMMNRRSGGWPLTVIMTPDAKVFFIATYIPSEERYGYKGLSQVLNEIVSLYRNRKDEVIKSAESIENASNRIRVKKRDNREKLDKNLSKKFIKEIESRYDFRYKGIGTQPKFPHASTIDTMLSIYELTGNKSAKIMALDMLRAMAKGGINDQIEGGFYRYSTDEAWIIPHFEKMLYTNAELIEDYSKVFKITKEPFFKKIADETISNINERFKKDNLYYSASDADSNGVEGKYFTFSYDESEKRLKKEGFSQKEIDNILEYFGIVEEGNFENEQNNPYITSNKIPKDIDRVKKIFREIRSTRDYPFIDYKIQTSWNALFIHSLFKAERDKEALKSLDTLLDKLYINGELYHQIVGKNQPKVKGYLEDYSFLIQSLIDAYEDSLDNHYLKLANSLSDKALKRFYRDNIWYMSNDGFNSQDDLYDSSYRSSMMVMVENLLKLALLKDNYKLYYSAIDMINSFSKELNSSPSSYAYGSKVALMVQNSIILIKSNRKNLLKYRDKIREIEYPFILIKDVDEDNFSACTMLKCFSSHKNLDNIIEDIKKYIKSGT